MHNVVKLLGRVAQRYYPSRTLSFEAAHIFKVLQITHENKRASRSLLVSEVGLGEGSVKTIVRHLKMHGLVTTSKAGMSLTNKGSVLFQKLNEAIPAESDMREHSISVGRFNHAILVRGLAGDVGSGIEQRDAAVKIGALGAITLVFRDNKLFTSDKTYDIPIKDQQLTSDVIAKLQPRDGDVIIVAGAENKKTADIAAKRAALETISNHEKHG